MAVWRWPSAAAPALDTASASGTGTRSALASGPFVPAAAPEVLLPPQALLLHLAVLLPLVAAGRTL